MQKIAIFTPRVARIFAYAKYCLSTMLSVVFVRKLQSKYINNNSLRRVPWKPMRLRATPKISKEAELEVVCKLHP